MTDKYNQSLIAYADNEYIDRESVKFSMQTYFKLQNRFHVVSSGQEILSLVDECLENLDTTGKHSV